MVVLVTSKNEEVQSKMKELEWSQHFSHYKSIGIFPANSAVRGLILPISNTFEILWLSSLPARIKNQSKMKEIERT